MRSVPTKWKMHEYMIGKGYSNHVISCLGPFDHDLASKLLFDDEPIGGDLFNGSSFGMSSSRLPFDR